MRTLILFAFALAACSAEAPAPALETPAAVTEAASDAPAAPAWEDARAQGVDFRAVGQEPGWMLDIHTVDKIVLEWDYAERRAEFPLPTPTYPQEGSTRYDAQANGHTIAITIRRFPCQDAMSGAAYPSTVDVTIDGRALQGCGRSV